MGIVININTGEIDVAASTPGTYRITYTTAGTCNNSSFQDITINALPTISIAGTDFCAGQSTTLTATPSTGTFVWEVNTGSGYSVISGQTNNTISVNTAGDYRAKVTDANGCTSAYSNVLAIAQFASPSVTIATVPGTTICTGDTATLTANATGGSGSGYTYLWSTSATTQAINVSPTTTTTYSVTVTDSNGCTATASQEITASTAGTAIAAIDNNNTMTFNGTDTYIAISNNNVLNSISDSVSISQWIKFSGTSQQYITSFGNDYGTFVNVGKFYFVFRNTSNTQIQLASNSTINDGNWHHVVGVKTTSNITIYIDGVLDKTDTTGDVGRTSTRSNAIGALYDGSINFNGSIDEVAIFNTALSSCDIKGIYDATTTVSGQPKTANLLDANTTIPTPVYWNRMGDS